MIFAIGSARGRDGRLRNFPRARRARAPRVKISRGRGGRGRQKSKILAGATGAGPPHARTRARGRLRAVCAKRKLLNAEEDVDKASRSSLGLCLRFPLGCEVTSGGGLGGQAKAAPLRPSVRMLKSASMVRMPNPASVRPCRLAQTRLYSGRRITIARAHLMILHCRSSSSSS